MKNAGFMPNFFSISRGVRQGYPIAPYLLFFCIEIVSATLLTKQRYMERALSWKIKRFCGKLTLESNLHIHDCSQITKENMFLRDLLAGWCKINNSESTHVIAKEIIWTNSLLPWLVWKADKINRIYIWLYILALVCDV